MPDRDVASKNKKVCLASALSQGRGEANEESNLGNSIAGNDYSADLHGTGYPALHKD
jgi:hypothetical protein